MPFEKPYVDKYTKGDLFYGFQKPRSALMTHLGIPVGQQGLNSLWVINNYMITGEEVDSIGGKLEAGLEKFALEEPDRLKASDPEWEKTFKKLPFRDLAKKEYLAKLNETVEKAKPDEASRLLAPHTEFKEQLQTYRGGKYAKAIGFKYDSTTSNKDDENARQNEAWRCKCKGGLYYAIFVLKANVHFCISEVAASSSTAGGFEDINHAAIAGKKDPYDRGATSTDKKFRVITPAELRWVYRNRESKDVQNHVQFWKYDGGWKPCGPPWAEGSDEAQNAWAGYKPKNASVHAKVD